jgi:hypothetical protein
MPPRIPARLLPHTVVVKPFLGAGPYGDVWGPEETVNRALVEDRVQVVRDATAREVTSSTVVYVEPRTLPAGSLVTVWPGTQWQKERKALAVSHFDHPAGLSHMVVYLE